MTGILYLFLLQTPTTAMAMTNTTMLGSTNTKILRNSSEEEPEVKMFSHVPTQKLIFDLQCSLSLKLCLAEHTALKKIENTY